MKLYTTPGGQWAGTEKDWKAALKVEGIDAKTYTGRKQIDIPTDKAGLMEFLTFYNVNVINPGTCVAVDAAGGGSQPPAPPPAVDLEALRALHNPGAAADPAAVAEVYTADPYRELGKVAALGAAYGGDQPTTMPDLDELFRAAPIPKQVELAVNLLDRLEAAVR